MKLTLAQVIIEPDPTKNKEKMLSVLQAAEKDEWVIFPEGTLSGYFPEQDGYFKDLDKAELEDAVAHIAEVVKQRECHCLYGTATYASDDVLNSVVIESYEQARQLYHKIELSALDRQHFESGSDVPVYKLGNVTFGVQVCRELLFPEAWRSLKKRGAQVVFHINNALKDHDQVWRHVSIARGVENANFVCSMNNGASPQKLSSHVVSPNGAVLLETEPSQEQTLSVDIDLSNVIDDLAHRGDF